MDRCGLFAITGPTGAGKSTLLDAICLALFDDMPRLPREQGVTVGRADEPEAQRIRSNDVRSILRRGSGDGYAEVDFIGNDERHYRARWEVRRARNKASGKLQAQELSLRDLATDQLLGRTKTEVLALISEQLGLSFTQFRRAVLLPQGDFAAFLKADGKSRSELLERITGTEIYTELSLAAHRRAAEEKKQLDDLKQQQDGLQPLDVSERQALEQRLTEQQANHRQAEQAQKAAQRIIDWHGRLAELEQLEEAATITLAETQQALQQAEPRRQEWQAVHQAQPLRRWVEEYDRTGKERDAAQQALEQAKNAENQAKQHFEHAQQTLQSREIALQQAVAALETARPQLQQARILDQQIAAAQEQQEQLAQDREQATTQLDQAKQHQQQLDKHYQTLRQQHDDVSRWLAQHNHLTDLAQQWERWEHELQRYIDADSEARKAHRQLQKISKRQAELSRNYAETNEKLTRARQSAEIAQSKLKALENTAQPVALEALAQQRNAHETNRERLQTALNVLQEGGAKQHELNQTRNAQQQVRERLKQTSQAIAEQANQLERQQAVLKEAEDALHRALIARKEDVRTLRAALRDSEPCPVCGSIDHPWVQDSTPLLQWVEDQQHRTEELKRQVQTLTASRSQQQSLHEQAQQQRTELSEREQILAVETAALQQRWQELPRDDSLAYDWLGTGLEAVLNDRLQVISTALAQIKKAEYHELELNQQINQARQTLDQCREQRDQLHTSHEKSQTAMQQLDTERATQQIMADQAQHNMQQLHAQLSYPLAGLPAWEKALTSSVKDLRDQCEQQVNEWRQQREQQDALEKQQQSLQLDRRDAENAVHSAQEQARNKANLLKDQQEKLQILQRQRAVLFDGRSVDTEEQTLQQVETTTRKTLEQANRVLERGQNEFTGAQKGTEHWQREFNHRQIAYADAQLRFNDVLDENQLTEATLRLRLERDNAWSERERTALDELRVNYERAQERLQERRNNRSQHQRTDPPAQRLEEAQKTLEQAQTASEIAYQAWIESNVKLNQDNEKRAKSTALLSSYKKQQQRWEIWESLRGLIGSHDGGVFRSYAQSLTLDVLLTHANHHLADLARRYRLERVPQRDLDIQVIDREMGDEVRGVHSLSGGESFLVSLALALGLASLSSNRTRVESLFIDEGFGSLDPDTLDIALASLDALQSLGRKVGVISHVPAMVERIGTQIRIEVRGGGTSRVRVMGTESS
jgi:exonuclease SbcC